MRARHVVAGLLTSAWLAACGAPETPVAPDTIDAPAPAPAAKGVKSRLVSVTVHEGTNMAVAVHPDGVQRVVSLQGQLFLLPGEGPARALTSPYYDAREPQFAADGASVVFHGYRHGNWDIFRVALAPGSAPERLTSDAFDDREPVLVAKDTRVLFSSDRGGNYDIWQQTLASGKLERLTSSAGDAFSPAMNAAGTLAYAEKVGSELYVVVHDGQRRVLAQHTGDVAGVTFTPDGQRVSYQVMDQRGSRAMVVDMAKARERISIDPVDVFPFRAAWLDAQTAVYTADGQIWRQTLGEAAQPWPFEITLELERHTYARRQRDYDAQTPRRALGLAGPVVSNDGAHIYFTALGDLWHWQPGAGALAPLTRDAFAESSPALRPDGGALAYVSDRLGKPGLYVMDLASGESRHLPVPANTVSGPSWSPDGKRLAFFVDVPGNPLGGQMMVMNVATGALNKVLKPMPAQPVSWRADGLRVAVTRLNPYSRRYREGMYELVVADVAGGESHTILPVPHRSISHATLLADGAMTYVQSGLLHRLELDADQRPLEPAGALTSELTDMPAFSADGSQVVYLSGDALKHLDLASGTVRDITPSLTYTMPEPQGEYVIRAGRVFTGAGDTYLTNQDIHVRGARIVAVQPMDPALVPDVDASRQAVIPGLFEMHAHMGDVSEPQGRVWLAHGITTVRDPGTSPYVAKSRQETWDAGKSIGPRTHITGYLTDGNRVYYSMAEGIVSEAHLALALERTAALELDFIKTYVRLPDVWQRKVVDFAHGIGIPVSSHELYPAVAHGADHVEHIGGTSRRGYQPKVSRMGYSYQDVVALLAESGMGLTATAVLPGFAVIVTEEPDWFDTPQFKHFFGPPARRAYQQMAPRFGAAAGRTAKANGQLLRALTERNALLVTGTDAPFVPYGAGLHAEFRLYDRAGLTGAQILHQATMKSAAAAGVAGELGQIAPGMLADLVIVDGDPLADIRDADNVVMTIKHGFRYPLAELFEAPPAP